MVRVGGDAVPAKTDHDNHVRGHVQRARRYGGGWRFTRYRRRCHAQGQLPGGEIGSDVHGRATLWASPGRARNPLDARRRVGSVDGEELACEGESAVRQRICQKAKLTNANEAARQHVLNEAPQELRRGERHLALFVSVGVILPAERYPLAIKGEQAMIADRDTVGVATEVAQHAAGPPKAGLA